MGKKRRLKERSLAVDGSKGLKRSSAAASRTPSSKLTNTKIDDLPDQVLIDILCRLPSCKLVHQCKLVSKRWRALMSDRHFIRQFLHLKHKQTPAVTHTLIGRYGEEFLSRMSSSSKPLRQLFKKIKTLNHLERDLVLCVIDTYNDLVLCSTTRYESDYYICNPFTNQFVKLPPPPEVFKHVHVGFICDRPYYNCKKDNQGGHAIEFNTEYNYKVVRLIHDYEARLLTLDKFNVHIFSSDTGEWREFILSSSSKRSVRDIHPNPIICNGMLYWMGSSDDFDEQFVIGLDPFMIENTNGSTTRSSISGDDFTDHIYQCPFIEIGGGRYHRDFQSHVYYSPCLGLNGGGCLRLAHFDHQSMSLDVCDVNVDQTARINGEGAAGKRSEEIMNNYSLDKKRIPLDIAPVDLLAFDPSDGDVLFCWMKSSLNKDIIMSCNIRTGALSKVDDQTKRRIRLPRNNKIDLPTEFYPLALPLWPTPLPKLPFKKFKKKKKRRPIACL